MHSSLSRLQHRPWELPRTPWSWRQSWCDLLFAHWPISVEKLRPFVPPELTIQEYEGTSWIGIVPFRMEGVMKRPFPNLPWISAFPELNVRVYVECEGKPGVWFLSLDATNPLAVWAARQFFDLPYHWSEISILKQKDTYLYSSLRKAQRSLVFNASYSPVGQTYESSRGSLEHWLTERYCLYALSRSGKLYRTEVHHHPWSLQRAEAEIRNNTMLLPFSLSVSNTPALLHFSRKIDVIVWPPELV